MLKTVFLGQVNYRLRSRTVLGAAMLLAAISFQGVTGSASAQSLVTARPTSTSQINSTRFDETLVAQRLLNAVGFSVGEINGELTPQTREAIRSFQRQNSLRVNGRVTLSLMTFLAAHALDYLPDGDTEDVLEASANADPDVDFTNRANVALVQRILTRHGFGPGRIDGQFSPYTEQAILNFQAKMDLEETGALSFDLLSALGDYDKRQ